MFVLTRKVETIIVAGYFFCHARWINGAIHLELTFSTEERYYEGLSAGHGKQILCKNMDCSKVNWKLKARNRNRKCHCVDWKIDWLVDFKITFAIYLFVDPFWYWRYWFRCLLRRDATKGLGFAQWLFPSFAGAPANLGIQSNGIPSLKLTANAPENRPKPNRKVVFQPSICRGELLVLGSVTTIWRCISHWRWWCSIVILVCWSLPICSGKVDETSDSRHAAGTPARMKLYPHHQHHGPTFLATCFISFFGGVGGFLVNFV